MCKFYSAIVMRNGDLLHNENLTSHEDIIDLFNINDNQFNCDKFVRVEYSPDENKDLPDITKYVLRVDESTTPDWFEKHREFITEKLKDIVQRRIITGNHKLLTGGLYVVKDAEIRRIKSAVVVYLQNSHVNEMRENSQVNEMWENSQVNEMRENSHVNVMRENSQVNVMRQNSQVNVMWENSQVNVMWENSQVNEMRENSQVNEMRENSQVKSNYSINSIPEKK